ncbi:hypothetical protein B0I35DRAFT_476385 [Stachybotrys elegans]|uniref:FAD-binding PCMH-type domain-containing protein n=1 Tax=Stachybotrys elegans TaxID=80388 RepID=A0A8K0SV29_9HYPO|nr:hypothetical protein B0I35DRAFT_476385 [Stachybotrys elegans]
MSSVYTAFFRASAFAAIASAAATGDGKSICDLANSQLPGLISYAGASAYTASQNVFYTGQERELTPDCVFRPETASQVSEFIKLVAKSGPCDNSGQFAPQFAVRSGGHTLFGGAANIQGGVTIDMRGLDSFQISDDHKVASVGGGTIWSDLYPKLEPYNLTVMGARIPGIGVGGFSLGGGMSFLARKHGWTCDNIYGYEVVLASGEIVHATADSHSDLWLALKGGSSNFGIVTRYDLAAFPQEQMWGGIVSYNFTKENVAAQINAFHQFMLPENFDGSAMMSMIVGFQPPTGFSISNSLFYMEPVPNPPAFQGFMATPSVFSTLSLGTVSETVNAFGPFLPPNVNRATELVYSFKNSDLDVLTKLFETWETDIQKIADLEGLNCQFLLQPQAITNGTNSLGLSPEEKDLIMVDITIVYDNASDDALVEKHLELMFNNQLQIVDERGLLIPFKYLNYADKSQNPLDSYGPRMKSQLQSVARKYDPKGLYQKAMPGGYKLF